MQPCKEPSQSCHPTEDSSCLLIEDQQIEPRISWCLSSATEMALVCSPGWEKEEEVGMWAACSMATYILDQFGCTVELYAGSVCVLRPCDHKNRRLCRFGSCYVSVMLFPASDGDAGAAAVWAVLCAQVPLSVRNHMSLPSNAAGEEQVGRVISCWTVYSKRIQWNCAVQSTHQYHLFKIIFYCSQRFHF